MQVKNYILDKEEDLSLYSNKKFDYRLGGYSHQERWSHTRWITMQRRQRGVKIVFFIGGKHQIINSKFHSHWGDSRLSKKATWWFQAWKQPNKALDKK
jgi:hypothetical protein